MVGCLVEGPHLEALRLRQLGGARSAVVATAAGSGAVTIAVALFPQLHFAYRGPALHVALETAASLIALLAAFLVFGRLRRRTRLNELMLACALAVLALSNLFFAMVPALAARPSQALTIWAALAGRSLGALLFAAAAVVPRIQLVRSRPVLEVGAAGVTAAVALIAVLAWVFAGRLPQALAAALPPHSAARPDLEAHPALLALQLVMALLYGLAAVGFLNRSVRLGDEFFGWLAIAAVLAAASHANYFLYPSQYSQWVYTGDGFRLLFYVVLLAGSAREIWSYWRVLSQAAVLEERSRIARDLHDGLAQELAYLARNLAALDGEGAALGRLRRAVERAQFESRRAINALAAPPGETVAAALERAVGEVAERLPVQLELDLAPDIRLRAARTEALVRIACEAVTNAARHSGAGQVRIRLDRAGPRVRLRVSDRGCGFDTTVQARGFGLISMRERARSAGGELRIASAPGQGSEVEVAL
jgi:signal transduction histidine kinase